MKKSFIISFLAALLVSSSVLADSTTQFPSYTYFDYLDTEFGGDGIPNDPVAVTVAGDITLGIAATQRYHNPPLSNDGAGTYFAQAGANYGGPGSTSTTFGATWNFSYYAEIANGSLADYTFKVLYDFDPHPEPQVSALGEFNINQLYVDYYGTPAVLAGVSLIEGSQNLMFNWLSVPTPTGSVVPPAGSFDPYATGQYSLAIAAYDNISGAEVARSAILVNVTAVPAPGAVLLGSIGVACVGWIKRRRGL